MKYKGKKKIMIHRYIMKNGTPSAAQEVGLE